MNITATIFDNDFFKPFGSGLFAPLIKETKPSDTSLFFQINEALSFLREKNCSIAPEQMLEIKDFLSDNQEIISYLFEAPDSIRNYFPDAPLSLEIMFDPEDEGFPGELFINIGTDLAAEDAVERLDMLDREWLVKKVGKDIGKFNVDLEFV
jgi:hypothetical protein